MHGSVAAMRWNTIQLICLIEGQRLIKVAYFTSRFSSHCNFIIIIFLNLCVTTRS